ncbi:hypothetical protein JCM5296_005296 [Sporobolomyces johnsonii]
MPKRARTRNPPPEVVIHLPQQPSLPSRRPPPPQPDHRRSPRAASAALVLTTLAAPHPAWANSQQEDEEIDQLDSSTGQPEDQQDEEDDSDDQVADELLSPRKPDGKGKAKAREETVVEETPDAAEDSFDPPKRSVRPSQTYRKRAALRKTKIATRQPPLFPESTSDDDDELQQVRQPVASTSNPSAQSAASRSPSRARSSPAKRPKKVVSSPRERPAPSLLRPSHSQRHSAASASRRRAPSRSQPRSPRKRSFSARSTSSEDDTDDDPDRPDNPDRPASFMCWDSEKDAFVPDLVWLHDEWTRPNQREKLVRAIEENGGTVVGKIKHARIAVLPRWYEEGYKELWNEAVRHDVQPVLVAWIHDALKHSSRSSPSYRPNPYSLAYQARRPPDHTKAHKERIVNLSLPEEALFEKLRNKLVMSVICKRMEAEFFHTFHRNAEDYAKILPAHLERRQDFEAGAKRYKPPKSRKRRREPSEEELEEVDEEDELDELEPEVEKSPTPPTPIISYAPSDLQLSLETLSAHFSQPLEHIRGLYFYASFDLALVESVLSALRKAHLLLHPASPSPAPASPNVIDAKSTFRYAVNHLWSFEQDEALLHEGARARIVRENEWPAEAVRKRERLLRVKGTEWSEDKGEQGREWRRAVWYPVFEEL